MNMLIGCLKLVIQMLFSLSLDFVVFKLWIIIKYINSFFLR